MTAPNIESFSKEMREKLAQVDFGLQVQAFLRSRIGQYLLERAQADVELYTQALKTHPVLADAAGAAELQKKIGTAENILYWLADAVREGSQLMEQMMAEERQALGIPGTGANDGDPTGN